MTDLIVMRKHGRTNLEHLLMRSIAEYVAKHSSIPVIVFRREKSIMLLLNTYRMFLK